MNSVGEAFSYPFRDPGWVGKIAVQGLITIIPIVGWIATAGWLMITFDNVRSGRQELAPAGFHLARGIGIFGVTVLYSLVLNIPAWILDGIGNASNHANGYTGYYTGSPLNGLGSLWSFLAGLFLDFLIPSLIVIVARNGFSGGFDLGRVWAMATGNMNNSVIGGLVIFVAGIIGALGLVACCIGVFFTIVYSAAINAGVAAWFERMQAAPLAPPAA
jgi:uncharacterized protein DUF4013